jgi:hypothetical protein
MTTYFLTQALHFLTLIIKSDSFVRVFTVHERAAFYTVHEALESVSHFPR